MHENVWFLIVGAVLVFMGIAATALKRLPCSAAMFYLAIGYALGPSGTGLLVLDAVRDAPLLRLLTEVALLVSLFAIGLRLRVPLFDRLWALPLRLGFVAMVLTVPLVAAFGVYALQLAWGPALLLAAILAPTDPVLAHDVQVQNPGDVDLLRFALSGEGGLNDGIALPFALLGLMWCAAPSVSGVDSITWPFAGSVLWGVVGALAVGGALGWAATHMVTWLRTRHEQALGLEGFFALGLIELAYGVAQIAHTYGFLAVFAAGVAMRRVEQRASGDRSPHETIGAIDAQDVTATAADPEKAHAYMAESVLGFTIELERIAEMAVMTMIGATLSGLPQQHIALFTWDNAALVAVLFLIVRPVAAELSLTGSSASRAQRRLVSWFGIRGIGSFYYLAFALERDRSTQIAVLVSPVLAVVAASVIVHGVSATPLMRRYRMRDSSQ